MSAAPEESPPISKSQLASALADSYREIESLKHALADAERRADHFENLVNTFQSASADSERAIVELRGWEKRARDAELARDEEIARRVAMKDIWLQLREYLRIVDEYSLDARIGFDKIIEAGGGDLSLKALPPRRGPFSIPQLPPLPMGRVRPRAESMDGLPPAKRTRFQPDTPYTLSQVSPPRNRTTHHSRSSSRSSNDSVDEMLIQASTESSNGALGGVPPPVSYIQRPPIKNEHRFYDQSRKGANRYPVDPSYPLVAPPGIPSGPSTGVVQSYQTHVFAPVVTGAPVKKGKFGSMPDPSDPSSPAVPTSAFPATNAEGQRICRQCGMAGRYKDGKCVEKWGPGPMGPGTVCDRCRKKMKRVERRGTLESQAQAAAAAQAQAQAAAAAARSAIPPPQESVLRRIDPPAPTPVPTPPGHRPTPTLGPHVGIESPTSHHPSAPPSSIPEESAIRTGLASGVKPGNGNGGAESRLIRPSSQNRDRNGTSVDVDADADADADEASSLHDLDVPKPEESTTADPDIDLLEAVHAAEANSTRSQSTG